MRIVADKSIDGQIAERLRRDGHEVLFIAEMEPGVEDEVVLARSREQDAVLLTADKDFGELVFRNTFYTPASCSLGWRESSRTRKLSWWHP